MLSSIEKALNIPKAKEFTIELTMHLATGIYYLGVVVVNRHDPSKRYARKFPAAYLYVDAHDAVRGPANLYPEILRT